MHGPAVVSWLLVALCAVTGMYCLATASGRGRPKGAARSTARTEALMGVGMAVMALPGVSGTVPAASFVVLFGAAAVRSAWPALPARLRGSRRVAPELWAPNASAHRGHALHHTLEALAMAYMALVMLGASAGPGGGHPGHGSGAGGVPLVTGALLAYFAVFVLCTGVRILPAAVAGATASLSAASPSPVAAGGAGAGRASGAVGGRSRPPGVAAACRLTLAVGSFTMLLTL